jgi:ABC-type multidrug transport system fused ATPase/permease subunit
MKKLSLLILKNLIKYTLLIFLIFLLIANVTLSINAVVDAFIKSVSLAILLVPISLINYFSPYIARNASYTRTLELQRSADELFKSARTLLKSMNDLKYIDSDSDMKTIDLESEFSKLSLKLEETRMNTTKVIITSTPRVYSNIQDYDKYTRDAKNVLSTLELHYDPENYDDKCINGHCTPEETIEEFKPRFIIFYRLIKTWFIISITMFLFFILYYFAVELLPNVSTIFFFSIIFLYIFYFFAKEVSQSTEYLTCPNCSHHLIRQKFNLPKYKLPAVCDKCNYPLIKTAQKNPVDQ